MFFGFWDYCGILLPLFLFICQVKLSVIMNSEEYKPINIRDIIASKSPGVARILPGFVYRYIHRIMHIDYVNEFLEKFGHLEGIDFVDAVVKDFEVKRQIIGLENLPQEGKFIFASNHPLGGFDGMILMKTVSEKLGPLKFLSNDVLMNIKNLSSLFVPVNKHGSYARHAAIILHKAYNSSDQILIFPSGLASRKIKGKIVDLEWKKHFITKSVEFKCDVIPVFIDGRNSNRFYWIAKIRKFLRIKWNLEMFFLPDETYRHRGKTVTIVFGKPIPYTTFDKSKTQTEWAGYTKELVYKLQDEIEKVKNTARYNS
jgi:putative hemolysin